MADFKLTQEELIETSPYFSQKQRLIYANQIEKNGRLASKTMDKIVEDYLQYYEIAYWTVKSKNGVFMYGDKRTKPLLKQDKRGKNRTDYAEYAGKAMGEYLLGQEVMTAHHTKVKWLIRSGILPEAYVKYLEKKINLEGFDVFVIQDENSFILEVDDFDTLLMDEKKFALNLVKKYNNSKSYWLRNYVFKSLKNYIESTYNAEFKSILVGRSIDERFSVPGELHILEEVEHSKIVKRLKEKHNIQTGKPYWTITNNEFKEDYKELLKKELGYSSVWTEEKITMSEESPKLIAEDLENYSEYKSQYIEETQKNLHVNWQSYLKNQVRRDIKFMEGQSNVSQRQIDYRSSTGRLYEYYFLKLDSIFQFHSWDEMEYLEQHSLDNISVTPEIEELIALEVITIDDIKEQINSVAGDNILNRIYQSKLID